MSGTFAPRAASLLADAALAPLDQTDGPSLAEALAAIDPFLTLGIGASALTAYMARPDPALSRFVIAMNGRPAGLLAVRWPWLRGPFLETLAILPFAQGRGLGGAALAWLVGETSGRARNLWTSVAAFNKTAELFYRSRGFEPVGLLAGLIRDDQDEILMRRRLS